MRMNPSLQDQGTEAQLIRVAFAADSLGRVNQHFGSARSFLLVGFDAASYEAMDSRTFEAEQEDGKEDKLVSKIASLKGMQADLLVCAQIGPSAVKQLLKVGIQPIAVQNAPAFEEVLTQLQVKLREGTATWTHRLKRTVSRADERFGDVLDEEWD